MQPMKLYKLCALIKMMEGKYYHRLQLEKNNICVLKIFSKKEMMIFSVIDIFYQQYVQDMEELAPKFMQMKLLINNYTQYIKRFNCYSN